MSDDRQKTLTGNNVSHANSKTKRGLMPNLQKKRFYLESEKRWIRLTGSPRGIKTITKKALKPLSAKCGRESKKFKVKI